MTTRALLVWLLAAVLLVGGGLAGASYYLHEAQQHTEEASAR